MTTTPPDLTFLHELSAETGRLLLARRLTIALAESCTGGLLASILTDVAGSSAYVVGGVVSYSNEAKRRLLGVPETTLLTHGAVSPQTAAAMAQGARGLFGSDLAVAVTGIAGPGGGTPTKPVGLVYLYVAAAEVGWGERHIWPYDRLGNKLASVQAALNLLIRFLGGRPSVPAPTGEPVVVEAVRRGERWRVEAVWWRGQRRPVAGHGRQTDQANGRTTVMVELDDGARLELLADVAAGTWRLLRAWPRTAAV